MTIWQQAWQHLRADRWALAAMGVVVFFIGLVLLAKLGWVAQDWQAEVAVPYANPHVLGATALPEVAQEASTTAWVDLTAIDPLAPRYDEWAALTQAQTAPSMALANTLWLGADRLGRSVWRKVIKGSEVSIFVGVCAALLATLIGTLLGAVAGFFGRVIGDFLEWVYNVFTAIPGILLIFAFATVLGRGTQTVVLILGLTGWTGTYRLVRAEFLKHRTRDYVRAAQAIGVGPVARMGRHILPNVSHVILVQLSLLVVGFIKAEVILSYLGLGVSVDQVSWGTLLADAQSELLLGYWWQLAATTTCMALFVAAFSVWTDAFRDALDPKLNGYERYQPS